MEQPWPPHDSDRRCVGAPFRETGNTSAGLLTMNDWMESLISSYYNDYGEFLDTQTQIEAIQTGVNQLLFLSEYDLVQHVALFSKQKEEVTQEAWNLIESFKP